MEPSFRVSSQILFHLNPNLLFGGFSKNWLSSNTFLIPISVTAISGVFLLLHVFLLTLQRYPSNLFARGFTRDVRSSDEVIVDSQPVEPLSDNRTHVAKRGGLLVYAFKVVRLLTCLILLALSILSAVVNERRQSNGQAVGGLDKWGKDRKRAEWPNYLSSKELLDLAMCVTYFYASMLAITSLASTSLWSKIVARHLNSVLFVSFGVYFYRDIFPLATFALSPMDQAEGLILWGKVALLMLSGVVIPLLIPRQYSPVDPEDPMAAPNPEQTASILSLITYSFLDPVVSLANRVPKLTHDQLPPLADYDYAKNLIAGSFPHLDVFSGASKRHLFFKLMRVFRVEYTILSLMVIIRVFASFASPLGIKMLLQYLETGGEGFTVKPWFWIMWLFVGPTLGSVAFQWYIFIATRTLVRAECIITQLVFEHSLRIRVKAEVTQGPDRTTNTRASTPDSTSGEHLSPSGSEDSIPPSQTNDESTESETLVDSAASIKSTTSTASKDSKKATKDEQSSNLVGKINNLVTTDLANIVDSRDFLLAALHLPLQITLCIVFLYAILGWSAFVGLAVIIVLFPLPGYVGRLVQKVQTSRLKKTDARVQTVTETMNVLRMIKMFGWEKNMTTKISEKREEELVWIWRRQVLDLLNGTLNFLIPVATMTVIMKQQLSASTVFSSMSVFDMLRDQLHFLFFAVTQSITGKVSLDRVNDFLLNTELLDSFSETESLPTSSVDVEERIGAQGAVFTWSDDTVSSRGFKLRIDEEVTFKPNCVNLIIGPTGCGKTSLLMALLGEMHYIPMGSTSWYNIPRASGISYAAQESWVQNETIRENILFGSPFDEERYNKVIYHCALDRDLELFSAGDQTEVGEKGLTLSGGQKARITLARAIYSPARIILLDDVLAALDVHTAKWIVDKCLSGDLIQGKTILLVTHNVAMTSPIAGQVVAITSDGRVAVHSTVSEAVKEDRRLAKEVRKDQETTRKLEDEVITIPGTNNNPGPHSDGKLIVAEEVEEGHVSWTALKLYFRGLGGNHPLLFFLVVLLGIGLTEVSNAIQTWFLGYWASQYDKYEDSSEVPVFYYLGVYGILLSIAVVIYSSSYLVYVFGSLRASRSLHKKLVESVLGTTLRWLDKTPTSRVITRCTQDIRAVDGPISEGLWWLAEMTMSMAVKFGAVILITPVFIGPGVLVFILGGWCGQRYIAAQLAVKRGMSNAKAPVLGHFGAAIAGLTSIRAYGAQQSFIKESMQRINGYTRAARTFYNLNRWICIRIDAIGGLFAAGLAAYLVYFQDHSAANTGFSLNMAVGFSGMILWWVRVLNDFEVQGNSLERIQGYIEIEQEPKSTDYGAPPAYWPASGKIQVKNLSASYSSGGPKVLHNLSFDIKAGERIGVVGRTGSGKSSLTLSLLRCIVTEGSVFYDGLDTSMVNLDSLRTNITIIPQIPELLSGTLRQNLDPFDQYDDATLNDALRSAGLAAVQSDTEEGRLGLDSSISSGGGNLSVGQRQILALARAIVRGSKLLILDEATSAIDHKTDSVIQSSLRNELGKDVTVITVAHRLQTIMDADKIMVLDAGHIVEFDTPLALLNKEGQFRLLVDESGDKDHLYAMARFNNST